MQKQRLKEKVLLFILSLVIVVLLTAVVAYARRVEKGNVTYPLSTLQINNTGHMLVENGMFPYYYEFIDTPYMIGVPGEGKAYVEGGYAYDTGKDFGLIVTETSKRRSTDSYLDDVLNVLYSGRGKEKGSELKLEDTRSGYLNGFAITNYIYHVKFEGHKNMVIFSYILDVSNENINLVAFCDDPTSDSLVEIRDYLDAMVHMIKSVARTEFGVAEQISQGSTNTSDEVGEDDTYIVDAKEAISTQTAVVTSENDYNELRLAFVYMNIEKSVENISVKDKDGNIYVPVSENAGEIVFNIPNVAKGDELEISVTAGNLAGCSVEMSEFSEYMEESSSRLEGTLHVEEYEMDDTESTENTDITDTKEE